MGVPKTLPRRERTSLPAACGGLPSGFWVRPKSNSPWPVRCSPVEVPPPPPKMPCNRLRPGCVSEGCEAGSRRLVLGPTRLLLELTVLVSRHGEQQHVAGLALVSDCAVFAAPQFRLVGAQGFTVLGPTELAPLRFVAEAEAAHKLEKCPSIRRDFHTEHVHRDVVKAPAHEVEAELELVRERVVEEQEVATPVLERH